MPETVQNCPLCGWIESAPFDQRTNQGEAVANRICTCCGLVFQSPRKSNRELAVFYEAEYRQLYQGSAEPNRGDLAVQAGRAQALLRFVEGRVTHLTRHLDIGCSAGLLLQYFQKTYPCQAVGVEPGEAYRAYAQGQGLRVYPSIEELRAGGEAPFDLVSLAHVLEHIPDPVSYLAALREDLLARDGRLLVEVPNLYAHDSFEIAHLVAYSPQTLAQALQKAGFEILAFQRHGQPRSQLIPLYLTALAHPSAPGRVFKLQPERGVRLKRRLGMLHRRLLARLLPRLAWSKKGG